MVSLHSQLGSDKAVGAQLACIELGFTNTQVSARRVIGASRRRPRRVCAHACDDSHVSRRLVFRKRSLTRTRARAFSLGASLSLSLSFDAASFFSYARSPSSLDIRLLSFSARAARCCAASGAWARARDGDIVACRSSRCCSPRRHCPSARPSRRCASCASRRCAAGSRRSRTTAAAALAAASASSRRRAAGARAPAVACQPPVRPDSYSRVVKRRDPYVPRRL